MTVTDLMFARIGQTIILIEPTAEGVFLHEVRPDGFIGDTWHPSIEEAQAQASFIAGRIVGPWRPIPADVKDKIAFAKARGRQSGCLYGAKAINPPSLGPRK